MKILLCFSTGSKNIVLLVLPLFINPDTYHVNGFQLFFLSDTIATLLLIISIHLKVMDPFWRKEKKNYMAFYISPCALTSFSNTIFDWQFLLPVT